MTKLEESALKTVPGFLTKTYDIFSRDEHQEFCGWGSKGDSIVIRQTEQFSKIVLPKYFKHSNFQSFVRQLNMYDFRKTQQDPNHGEFYHPYFKYGRQDLLVNIKRKANSKDSSNQNKTQKNNSRSIKAKEVYETNDDTLQMNMNMNINNSNLNDDPDFLFSRSSMRNNMKMNLKMEEDYLPSPLNYNDNDESVSYDTKKLISETDTTFVIRFDT